MTALNVISDLDDGLPVSPDDLVALDAAEAHASVIWHRREQRLADLWREGGCCVCGVPLGDADGDECDDCVIAHDITLTRLTDI